MTASVARRRACWLLAVVAISLLVTASPAAAGVIPLPADRQHGVTGSYSLTDTPDTPGGFCSYGITVNSDYYNFLRRVGVAPPVVYASKARAHQKVTWQLRVVGFIGSHWHRFAQTGWERGTATPTTPASFHRKHRPVDSFVTESFADYRARIAIRWYAPDGVTVVGNAVISPHYYRNHELDMYWVTNDFCGITTG